MYRFLQPAMWVAKVFIIFRKAWLLIRFQMQNFQQAQPLHAT